MPKYRGASPIQTAILSGDKITGVTIMLMDEKMDHGPILFQKSLAILDRDNYQTLSNKMSQESASILLETLERFLRGEIKPKPQNHKKATITKLIKKDDGYFDINNPPTPKVLDRMIRAYYPWPGVWTRFRASSAEAAAKAEQGSSGQAKIVKFLPENMVQMEGKKAIPIKDFLNGYPDFPIKNI